MQPRSPRDVGGFVRNLRDGRVHLVAEGERAEVERFLAAVAQRMVREIRDAEVDWHPASGGFARFEIVPVLTSKDTSAIVTRKLAD